MSVQRPSTVHYRNDLPVPMRDGVRLSADVYLPAARQGPGRSSSRARRTTTTSLMDLGFFWAQHGYVYVAQDVRGRYDSEGDFVPWDHETNDGYDTLEWIGQQAWCDGNVGMTGGSYLGQVQWQAAFTGHPLLKTIAPRVMGNNLWDSPHYQGGAFGLGVNAVWGWRTMGRTMQRIDRFDWPAVLRTLPLREMDEVSGKQHPAFSTWLDHHDYDDYWRATAVDEHFARFTIPVLQVCGWYDLYAGGMMANFVGSAGARRHRAGPREPADHHGALDAQPGRHRARRARPTPATAISALVSLLDTRADRAGLVRPLAEGDRQRRRARSRR